VQEKCELSVSMDGISRTDTPALELRGLVKKFGELTAVDHLSLKVNRSEVFGFLGPNGAGKTTSIRMMCGLLKPTLGEVLIDGNTVTSVRKSEIRSKVGICPQENILWNKLTCFEQLVFSARMYTVPRREAESRADRLLQIMGLSSKRNKMAATLSGGMKRRMNVIMAMMHDPEILVFDEPEAGLDPQSRVLVREFIRDTARQKTVIVTTHNMDEAERIADRVAIIDSGQLLQLGTPDMLKSSIGEGDILELLLKGGGSAGLDRAETCLEAMDFEVNRVQDHFVIRARNLISRIQEIYLVLEKEQIRIGEMKIRQNTLEDVFIHLTGKRLRS
jgi:ABC-2 type transport system ATP-binding protein